MTACWIGSLPRSRRAEPAPGRLTPVRFGSPTSQAAHVGDQVGEPEPCGGAGQATTVATKSSLNQVVIIPLPGAQAAHADRPAGQVDLGAGCHLEASKNLGERGAI